MMNSHEFRYASFGYSLEADLMIGDALSHLLIDLASIWDSRVVNPEHLTMSALGSLSLYCLADYLS